jgi:hypothetical protein
LTWGTCEIYLWGIWHKGSEEERRKGGREKGGREKGGGKEGEGKGEE